MTDQPGPQTLVSLANQRRRREVDYRVEGDSLREAVAEAGVPRNEPVEWQGTVYVPVWHGCVDCIYRAVHTEGDDPLEPGPGRGVYQSHDASDERRCRCTICDRRVEPLVENVELITDRWGPEDTDVRRLLIDRIVGYVPAEEGEEASRTALELCRERWETNVRAVLGYAGLIDAGEPVMVLDEDGAEFW